MNFRKRIAFSLTIFIFLCVSVIASAQPSSLQPTGYVNDFAGIIDSSTKNKLEQLLTAYEQQTTNEVSVVTVPSLDDVPIEDYAVQLFEKWGIGKKEKDNGLLLLVAPNERKARIEVGYGLEGAINDALAGKILDNTVIPWFRQNNYADGILNGTVESIRIINERYDINFDPAAAASIGGMRLRQVKQRKSSTIGKIFKVLALIFVVFLFIKNPWAGLFFLSAMSGGRGGGSFRGGGFGGGGFSSFGGGMSGGGGASRGW